jgi:hypothetical protein
MKSMITLLTALAIVLGSVAQSLDFPVINMLSPEQQKEALVNMQQARSSKISGWAFCISGVFLATLGTIMVMDSEKQYGYNALGNYHQTGTVLVLAGAATLGFSFRLFRSSKSKTDRVNYMISQSRKAVISPGYSPATQTAGLKLVIPVGK